MKPEKADWGPGPWQDEPDEAQWTDKETGLACELRRGPFGAWCGYVDVPKNHPAHGRDYDDLAIDVHGGLTYAAPTSDGDWRLGFDCAHAWDLAPGLQASLPEDLRLPHREETYRDEAYARAECTRLALQLRDMMPTYLD